MSKYNLTDIFEQYRIGSGYTNDFDYFGMLMAGLKVGVDTDIEILKKMSDDFEDVNYHRENNHLQKAIDALEEGAIKEASMFFGDFHAEIKDTMEMLNMDIEPTLGKFMASKMGFDESFDSLAKKLDKQKGIDKDEAAKIAGKIANIKRKGGGKGPTAKQKKRMKEAREYAPMDRDVANRIESFLNIPMKKKFLDAWEDLFYDLVDDEPFYVDDVIAHLANEMSKSIHGNQMAGDRLAGIGVIDDFEQEEFTAIPEGAMQPGEADLEAGVKGNMDAFTEGKGVDFIRALKVDANGTSFEIKSYLESLKRSGDKFDSVDDYVEDFKNYVADKSLQEHFGRFLKDYQ